MITQEHKSTVSAVSGDLPASLNVTACTTATSIRLLIPLATTVHRLHHATWSSTRAAVVSWSSSTCRGGNNAGEGVVPPRFAPAAWPASVKR